jgi:hypothetical protein
LYGPLASQGPTPSHKGHSSDSKLLPPRAEPPQRAGALWNACDDSVTGSDPCACARAHDGQPDSLGFPAGVVAKSYGASVEADTTDGDVAYAPVPPREPTAYRDGWLPE